MNPIQHVMVKVFAREPVSIDLGEAIPIFHRWIQDHVCPELLIDVADYRHVPNGPGVMLIGHEANYSLDMTKGRLGLLYNRKQAGGGPRKICGRLTTRPWPPATASSRNPPSLES